jgi:predicted nucleic acid-binding protein
VAALVDTNVLVYRYDPRFPTKQEQATELLRQGIADGSIVLPYQALVEFVAASTRSLSGQASLLTREEALREVEDLLAQFQVVYPTENTFRVALRGAALYQMSWFDSLIWAYADEHGLNPVWSEDFEDGRLFTRTRHPTSDTVSTERDITARRPRRVCAGGKGNRSWSCPPRALTMLNDPGGKKPATVWP